MIVGGYYWIGDNVELELDGIVSFIGCVDDVIMLFGYWIGLFDVESVLIEYLVVSEVVVIGVFDLECMEIVKVFVVLLKGFDGMLELVEELSLYVKWWLFVYVYLCVIDFVDVLLKILSGKI